jgi:hypothetical protein
VVQTDHTLWYTVPEKVLVLFALNKAVSIKARYIEKPGNVFQFVMRVPADLIHRYGKDRIRESLKTRMQRKPSGRQKPLPRNTPFNSRHFKVTAR